MKGLIIFLSGVAIGSAAAWFYQAHKYEQIIDEEIESVKDTFKKKEEEKDNNISIALKTLADEAINKPDVSEIYKAKLEKENYINYNVKSEEPIEKKEREEVVEKPYIIDQGDFRQFSNYKHVTLDYYADGVLTDADYPDDPIDDIEEIVGNCLKSDNINERVDDWIYIRNDSKKCDYEIFVNDFKFSEREE